MHGYESETMVGRYLGRMQWWFPYVGFDYPYKVEGGPKISLGMKIKIGLVKQVINLTVKLLY